MTQGIESFYHIHCNHSTTYVIVITVSNSLQHIYKDFLWVPWVIEAFLSPTADFFTILFNWMFNARDNILYTFDNREISLQLPEAAGSPFLESVLLPSP